MPFYDLNGLRYYSFDIFPKTITQAVFTRARRVSPAPWSSLNLGGSVGDDPAHVTENRTRVFNAMKCDPASIHDVWLKHGTDIVYADAPRLLTEPAVYADIIFTNNPEVTLFMRFGIAFPFFFMTRKKTCRYCACGLAGNLAQRMRRGGSWNEDAVWQRPQKRHCWNRSFHWRGSLRSWRGSCLSISGKIPAGHGSDHADKKRKRVS